MFEWIKRVLGIGPAPEPARFDHSQNFSPEVIAWIEESKASIEPTAPCGQYWSGETSKTDGHLPSLLDATPSSNYSTGGHHRRDL